MTMHTREKRAPFLHRLLLTNYKSIAKCDVVFSPFTALVGPNGAGKSNLLDSLRFVADSLRNSLEYALRDRGGIKEVRRRSKGHPTHFGIRLELSLAANMPATYTFRIGASSEGGFIVQREECKIERLDVPGYHGGKPAHYTVVDGELAEGSEELQSAIEPDRLYLGAVSALPSFRPLYDALTRMGFYNLSPESIRDLQSPDPAEVMARDGSNIASILRRLQSDAPETMDRVEQYLEAIVPGIRGVSSQHLGPKETIEFRQDVPGDPNPWRFLAANMSDGTLRALGVLVALFQGATTRAKRVPLVGIEEPEAALHPAAAGALATAILEASKRIQVLLTSHSPDLLDNPRICASSLLAVVSEKGQTIVGPVDRGTRDALRQRLYTTGELLRLEQIQPSQDSIGRSTGQLDLFRSGAR